MLVLDNLAGKGKALPAARAAADSGISVAGRARTLPRGGPNILLADCIAHADDHAPLPNRWGVVIAIQNDLQ